MCSRNTPGHYGGDGSACDADFKGATYLINTCNKTVTQTKSNGGQVMFGPCGKYLIGVLWPDNISSTDNCAELKAKSEDAAFNAKMAELKTKAGTQNFESAYVMYGNATQGLLFSNEYKGSTAKPEVSLKLAISNTQANANSIGFIHCHLDNGKTFKIFSLSDIVALAKLAKISTNTPKELALYVVTSSGTFALKINNITALKDAADIMEGMQDFNEPEFERHVEKTMSLDKQVLGFLKFLKKMDYNYIDLYQQNTDINDTNNYLKWQKLKLNGFGAGINKTNC